MQSKRVDFCGVRLFVCQVAHCFEFLSDLDKAFTRYAIIKLRTKPRSGGVWHQAILGRLKKTFKQLLPGIKQEPSKTRLKNSIRIKRNSLIKP
jgi:hypothetical protein